MDSIEELLRRRKELLEEIDGQIAAAHTREVTLLFTDIVGSTGFYERMGDIAGRQMVQTHNDLLFPIIESFGGKIVKTIGDSIMACFSDPGRAVVCTVEMQKAIQGYNQGASAEREFRVRMGLHSGRAVVEERDLFGDVVNTAARVESLAKGEEILLSGAVKDGMKGVEVPLLFLGEEEVKGKEEKVAFYLVNWQDRTGEEIMESWRERTAKKSTVKAEKEPEEMKRGERDATGTASRILIKGKPDPRRELENIARLPSRGNPYLNRVMVPHPDMFFGRSSIVRRIMSRVSSENPQSVSLVGERRIGKSSLLNFLRSPKARLEWLERPDECIPLYVDFQQARALDQGQFFSLIFSELKRKFPNIIELDLPASDEGMRSLCEAVADSGLRLALLFDEFECVTKNEKVGPSFYSFLRSLANTFPVCFITSSGRDLKDMCVSREISDSPFFNIFSVLHVGAFQREEAETLVRVPSEARGIPLAPLCEGIIRIGGLYPFFLQMAASAWFEYLESEKARAEDFVGKPVPKEVRDVFREESRPHFEFIMESASAPEREVFRSLGHRGEEDASVPAAQELERKGYAIRSAEKILPFSEEFGEFLRKT